ncbi:MAG: alpha/beta fold hydrolase [Phycisphaerales bacterium]|nr:alpha/beta fold hydrolase [Phycisphaerales bacterium]
MPSTRPVQVLATAFIATMASHSNAQVSPEQVPVRLPEGHDPSQPAPLIVALHGYTGSGDDASTSLFGIWPMASEMGFLYVSPTGSQDFLGNNFWNATDACCDFFNMNVDHVGYIRSLIETVQNNYNVDPDQIHLIGHSNGGFMCHAMACAHPELIASITALAGVIHASENDCQASETVNVLHLHGTADDVIVYDGGWIFGSYYPSAWETVDLWAELNGCGPVESQVIDTINMDNAVGGNETTIRAANDCEPNGSVELWSLEGSSHGPSMTNAGREAILQYMLLHGKNEEPACPGDVNGDLVVAIEDLLSILKVFGQSGGQPADLNGDGLVDVKDVIVCIDHFGVSC